MGSLEQQLVDLQHEMLHANGAGTTDMDGHSARAPSVPIAAPFAPTFPAPFAFPLSPPERAAVAASATAYPYEDMVELHETVHSLDTQLCAVRSQLSEWQQRAVDSEERVREMSAELSTLRLMRGDEGEVARWRAEQQRQAREEMREWRRQQELQCAQRVAERDRAASGRRKGDEQREEQSSAAVTRELQQSLSLTRELHSLWRQAMGVSAAVEQPPLVSSSSPLDLPSSLRCELSALHRSVADDRASRMLEQSSGQCPIQ